MKKKIQKKEDNFQKRMASANAIIAPILLEIKQKYSVIMNSRLVISKTSITSMVEWVDIEPKK